MSRKLKLVLLASLIVNVVLLGILLGQTPGRFDRDAVRRERMDQILEGLPADSQKTLREKIGRLRSSAQPQFEEMRSMQEDALRLLAAEPFNEAAYDAQVEKLTRLRNATTAKLAQDAKDSVRGLSPEERRRFSDLLRRPRPPERKR